MLDNNASMRSRLLTAVLLVWVIFVNLAYCWHVARAYGPQVAEIIQSLLPW